MRLIPLFAIATLLVPGGAFAASKEQQEMQRDIAQLQDQVRTLQSTIDKNLATIQTLQQQALDVATRSNTSVSVLSSSVTQTVERELKQAIAPIAGLAAKVDNTNNDVAEVRSQVSDLNTSMNKVLQLLTDMNNTLKVIQAPPAAPPPGPGGSSPAAGGPPPPAATLFGNALTDQNGGKADLAIQEYTDFLKYYPTDPNGANAQFNIGEIHYAQNKLDLAVQDFDAVIERYPDNTKLTPDAYFMKGMALKQSARKDAAASTFRALISKFPNSENAGSAKTQLRAMGFNVPASAPAATKRKAR